MEMSRVINHGGKNHVISVGYLKDFVDFDHYIMKKSHITLKTLSVVKFFIKVVVPLTFFFTALWTATTPEPDQALISFVIIPALTIIPPLLFVNELANKKISKIRGDSLVGGGSLAEGLIKEINSDSVAEGWTVVNKEEVSVKVGNIMHPADFVKMVRLGLSSSNATDIIDALEMLENPTIRRDNTMSEKLLMTMYKVGEAEKKRIADSVDSAVEEINTRLDPLID